jgi:hypothetical protein
MDLQNSCSAAEHSRSSMFDTTALPLLPVFGVLLCGLQHYATLADQTGGWDGWTAANLPVKK